MFLSAPISALYEHVGNFGLTVILTVLAGFLITVPFKIMSNRNTRKKKTVAPLVKDIQKKYHANAMGVSTEDDDTLPEEIRAMSKDERAEKMNHEILSVYREHKYHAFIGWLPGAVSFIIVILLYIGISAAIPEGDPFGLTWKLIKSAGGSAAYPVEVLIYRLLLIVPATIMLIRQIPVLLKKHKVTGLKGKDFIAPAVGVILILGLMIFVSYRSTVAIALAVLCMTVYSFIWSAAETIYSQGKRAEISA